MALPAGAIAWITTSGERFDALERQVDPMLFEVRIEPVDESQAVSLVATWKAPQRLIAPRWEGVVTAAPAEPALLRSGDTVAVVGGVARLAWHTAKPFYRDLSPGAVGEDVGALQEMLRRLGVYRAGISNRYTQRTAEGVRKLSERLGVTPAASTFDRGWIVWLPTPDWVSVTTSLVVGAPAPPAGNEVLSGAVQLRSVDLVSTDGEALRPAGDRTVVVNGISVVVVDGKISSAELEKLRPALTQPVSSGGSYPSTETPATIRRNTPIDAFKVPASAVSVNTEAEACIWVSSGEVESTRYTPQEVTVVASQATRGTVWVARALSAEGRYVLANPSQVLQDARCPSP